MVSQTKAEGASVIFTTVSESEHIYDSMGTTTSSSLDKNRRPRLRKQAAPPRGDICDFEDITMLPVSKGGLVVWTYSKVMNSLGWELGKPYPPPIHTYGIP